MGLWSLDGGSGSIRNESSPHGSDCWRGSTKSESSRKGVIHGRRDDGVWE